MKTKDGLNDSDKIFVTFALWIAATSLFATALTLPMLPDMVTIFYKPVDVDANYFSKYNNLLIVLSTVIPVAIILTAASLRKRNRVQHSFPSILLFCIMLSVCMAGVEIYGICQQFVSSNPVESIDVNSLIALTSAVILSMLFAFLPALFHSRRFVAGGEKRPQCMTCFCSVLNRFWNVGAYGFIVAGAACSFLQGPFAYIPVTVYLVFFAVFILIHANKAQKNQPTEQPESDK